MRLNPPRMVNPVESVRRQTGRALGIQDMFELTNRLGQIDETIRRFGRQMASADEVESALDDVSRIAPLIQHTVSVKGSMTPTAVSSTSGTTIVNSNIGPLIAGVPYLIVAFAGMALNAPAGQSIIACTRIDSSGSTIDGTRTTTVGGERWGMGMSFLTVVGTGSTVNVAGRARVTGGSGSINDAISAAMAFPLGGWIEV